MEGENRNLLLGVTGSVAAIKTAELVSCLTRANFRVKVIVTANACYFFDKSQLQVPVYTDADEYSAWGNRGDPVLHIQLRNWADIFLIAPLSANTLAKIACGICDNLLTCVARAWNSGDTALNCKKKVSIFAPAMNTSMWENPLTSGQVNTLCNILNWLMIGPICKTLMCGELGPGAMEEPQKVVEFIKNLEEVP